MKASEIIALLKKDGWFEIAQKGSHKQFKHDTKKGRVTVPYHSNVDLSIAVIKSIEKTSSNKNFKKVVYFIRYFIMKKNIETFVANIYKVKSGYNSTFYDFDGCVSAGKTLEETINNSKIALQMHIDGMIEDGEKIPKSSSLEKIIKETEDEPITRMLIEVKVSREKKKRIDVTLDESLIKMIDNLSSNRSEFITIATKNYISNYYK